MEGTNRGSFAQRSGSVMIPSSAVIAINFDLLLKRSDVFGPDADEFRPRRFVSIDAAAAASEGVAAGGNQRADPKTWFVSGGFGIGARGCPAGHWALPVAAELLRAVLHTVSVTHAPRASTKQWTLQAAARKV